MQYSTAQYSAVQHSGFKPLDIVDQVSQVIRSPSSLQRRDKEGTRTGWITASCCCLDRAAGAKPQLSLQLKHLSVKLASTPRDIVLVQGLHLSLQAPNPIRGVPDGGQYSAVQHSAVQHNTLQCSTAQYSAV